MVKFLMYINNQVPSLFKVWIGALTSILMSANLHNVVSVIMMASTIGYTLWKWRRDYEKSKKEDDYG